MGLIGFAASILIIYSLIFSFLFGMIYLLDGLPFMLLYEVILSSFGLSYVLYFDPAIDIKFIKNIRSTLEKNPRYSYLSAVSFTVFFSLLFSIDVQGYGDYGYLTAVVFFSILSFVFFLLSSYFVLRNKHNDKENSA